MRDVAYLRNVITLAIEFQRAGVYKFPAGGNISIHLTVAAIWPLIAGARNKVIASPRGKSTYALFPLVCSSRIVPYNVKERGCKAVSFNVTCRGTVTLIMILNHVFGSAFLPSPLYSLSVLSSVPFLSPLSRQVI